MILMFHLKIIIFFPFIGGNDIRCRSDSLVCVIQVVTVSSSVPPKVSAALSAAEEARRSVEDLLQRERLISNKLHQVDTLVIYCSFCSC